MEGRLQFKYDDHLYSSKADIKSYVDNKVKDEEGKFALFSEPIVFKYGTDAYSPNIVLAIGSYGNGKQHSQNKYFFIDSAQMEKDIAELQEGISGHTEEIAEIKTKITNILSSVGLKADGTIDFHDETHHLSDKKYLSGCTDILYMLISLNNAMIAEETVRLATDNALDSKINKEISDRANAVSAETAARIQGDIDDRNFAYNLYKEKTDNAVKIENIDANNKEVSLKIKDGELILSQNTYGLTTTLNISYNESGQTIQIKGIDGAVVSEMDASPFIKDGFLASAVTIEDVEKQKTLDPEGWAQGYNRFPYIFLLWKTEAALYPTRLPLDELIDVYKAGNGLSLSAHTFSVNLDSTCEPYLTVGENGLKLSGVNAAIDTAKKAATTKVEKDPDSTHITLSSRTNADSSTTYIINETNIASNNDLQEFKGTIREELDEAITALCIDVDSRISEAIADEVTNRNAAIDVVKHSLSAETAERKSEDARIEALIANEATLRTNADNALEDKISEEKTNRISGDTQIRNLLTSEETARKESDTQIKNLLTAETENRKAAISAVETKLTAEETARKNADKAIQDTIGVGFDNKTITSAVTEDKNNITKINETIGSGFTQTTITSEVDRIAKKLENTYSAVTANTSNITKLKNIVGEGLDGGETLTYAMKEAKTGIQEHESALTIVAYTLEKKVDKVEGSSLMTANEHTKLSNIEDNADVNKIEIIKRNGKVLDITANKEVNIEVPVEKISDTEKQLSLISGELSSTFEVEYDESANTIYFYGKNRTEIGRLDASKFVTEGFLKDVRVEQIEGVKYLVFEFIKSDGTTKTVKVKLTDLVTEYTVAEDSKAYLKIEDFKIGVKVNTSDKTGLATEVNLHTLDDKYSAITHNIEDIVGEGFTGETITHKVQAIEEELQELVDSDMKFKDNFTVAGIYGVLGTGAYKNGDVIPAGTSLMKVIKDILQKELNPTAINPTVVLKLTNTKLTYEVGSTVTPSFQIVYTDGKYTYDNGSSKWAITDVDSYAVYSGSSTTPLSTLPQGELPQITIADDTNYAIRSIVHHKAGEMATTNLGKEYPDATIQAANIVSNAEEIIKGYRSFFYGTLSDSIVIPETETDWSNIARTLLTMSENAPEEISIPTGSEKIVIAIPGTSSKSISKVYDSQTGYDITDEFNLTKNIVKIGGVNGTNPIFYNLYAADPLTSLSGRKFYILYK